MAEPQSEVTNNQSIIDIVGASRYFGSEDNPIKALDDVNLSIRHNEFFTLLGPSGCGKTTLLRLIAGFDFPTKGEIRLNGQDIAPLPPYKRPVNTVFQNYALFPHMTVAQNIAFGLEMLGKSKSEIGETVDRMLGLVRLEAMRDRPINAMSGGQQQRVALARALAPAPEVLLLDEPLSALDLKLRKEMQIELKRLQHETAVTFIFVTHDQEEALTMSDRIAVLSDGKLQQVGEPRQIYDRPFNRFVANFIGESNTLPCQVLRVNGALASVQVPSGPALEVFWYEGLPRSGSASLIIRPEHASLVPEKLGELKGVVENMVFFGTDTHVHVLIDGGYKFVVRCQNRVGQETDTAVGQTVGISLAAHAATLISENLET